jgi:polar amino acid transport system substrate-binding protein
MKKIVLALIALFMMAGIATAETKITLATVDWEPYYGSKLENGGFTVAIADAAFKKVGYAMEIQYMDWNRAVALTTSGKVDGLFGCYRSAEREKVMNMSEALAAVELVLFSKKGANITYSGIESLKPYKIGIMRGNANTEEFDSATFLKKESVNKLELNVKKLLGGRIDLIIGSKLVIQDLINKQFAKDADKIEVVKPALQSNALHIGFSRKIDGHDKIVADFNKGLQMIKDDGTMAAIAKKYGF